MKKIYCFFLFALFLQAAPTQAQTVPADLEGLLNHTLDSMRNVLNAKSLSAALQLPDGAVWAHAKGISSLNPPVDASPAQAYLIGSVTKTITAACILQLADENVLSLDDSLNQWLDTMQFINPDITIRQLMQHTSGIYDVLSNPNCQPALLADLSAIWTPQALIDDFLKAPLFQPGTNWSYSNTNYMLLSMIIEVATGNPFYVELRNRFFQPLGLGSFAIPAFEPLGVPVAHVWIDITGDGIQDDAHSFYMQYLSLNSTAGAAGGYFSTPTDCTKWMRSYMRGDVVSPSMMEQAKIVVAAPGSQGGKYGLGLMENKIIGQTAFGHGGDLAYHASSWYFPDKDVSITVFTNDDQDDSWDLLPVVAALLKTCMEYEPVSAAPLRLDASLTIEAFPNPFSQVLKAKLDLHGQASTVEWVLTNATGGVVKTFEQGRPLSGKAEWQMDGLESLPSGVYFLTAITADGRSKALRLVR